MPVGGIFRGKIKKQKKQRREAGVLPIRDKRTVRRGVPRENEEKSHLAKKRLPVPERARRSVPVLPEQRADMLCRKDGAGRRGHSGRSSTENLPVPGQDTGYRFFLPSLADRRRKIPRARTKTPHLPLRDTSYTYAARRGFFCAQARAQGAVTPCGGKGRKNPGSCPLPLSGTLPGKGRRISGRSFTAKDTEGRTKRR